MGPPPVQSMGPAPSQGMGPAPQAPKPKPVSSHGMELNMVGGHADVAAGTAKELAAAAVSSTEAVIQHDGQSFVAPIDQIDPDAVELACNDEGCALIPDDGNPYNDIVLESLSGGSGSYRQAGPPPSAPSQQNEISGHPLNDVQPGEFDIGNYHDDALAMGLDLGPYPGEDMSGFYAGADAGAAVDQNGMPVGPMQMGPGMPMGPH